MGQWSDLHKERKTNDKLRIFVTSKAYMEFKGHINGGGEREMLKELWIQVIPRSSKKEKYL